MYVKMEISKTLLAKQIKLDRLSKNLPVYDGGLGENPVPQPKCMIDTLKKYSHLKQYTSSTGIKELQDILGKNLIVGNGLKPLLFLIQLAFSKLYSNGIILYFTPYWLSYKEQTNILNIRTIEIRYDNNSYKVTPALLENTLKYINVPHMILFNNPNNPSGLIYKNEEVEKLCEVFKKYNSIVLSDEIYNYLGHDWTKIHSPYVYYDNVIVGNSLSKNFASGGYRLGWLKFPEELKSLKNIYEMCKILASSIYSCPSVVFQHVAVKALSIPQDVVKSIKFQKMMYSSVADYCKGKFKIMNLNYTDSSAAWYFLLDFINWENELEKIGIHTSDQLNKHLAETLGFITVSGSAFGIKKQLILRYSYVDIKDINVETDNCDYSNIVKGLEVLHDWLLSI